MKIYNLSKYSEEILYVAVFFTQFIFDLFFYLSDTIYVWYYIDVRLNIVQMEIQSQNSSTYTYHTICTCMNNLIYIYQVAHVKKEHLH